MSRQPHHDVVVIGAGLAGLSAARRLTQLGRDVVVLEALETAGGRVGTINAHDALIETGGMYVVPAYSAFLALTAELGLRDAIVPIDRGLAFDIWTPSGWQVLDMGRPVSMLRSTSTTATPPTRPRPPSQL